MLTALLTGALAKDDALQALKPMVEFWAERVYLRRLVSPRRSQDDLGFFFSQFSCYTAKMQQISAKHRQDLGRKVKTLRRHGFLPAVLYGEGVLSTPLLLLLREFEKALDGAGETSLVSLVVESDKTYNVLIHDVARDPISLQPIHADFYAVRMDRVLEAKVPLNFVGESPAVKNEGGILVKVLHELEIKALPKDLPHEITVDLSSLDKIDSKIHVRELKLPAGVSTHVPLEEVVALIEPPRSEAELEALTKAEEKAPVVEVKTEREVKAETKEPEPEEGEKAAK